MCTGGRTLRHNQIFLVGGFAKFSYPWCSAASALRARESSAMNDRPFVYRAFVCQMLKYGMHKLNLSYDKRATQTAFCFTTPLPNELRAILRVLIPSNQASLAKNSQRTQTYFWSTLLSTSVFEWLETTTENTSAFAG